MNYSEPLSNQIIVFIRCVGLGVLLGFLFEVFSVLRALLSDKKWAYVLCDISFSLIATVISFFFMVLYNSGIVRLNLIAAQLLGGVAFHLTAGKYLIKPLIYFGEKLRKLVLLIFYPFKLFLKKAGALLHKIIKKTQRNNSGDKQVKKDRKKFRNIIKIPLKK